MQPPDYPVQPPPRRVTLLGASVRAAAESAKRGGFRVIGGDLFADSDTLEACTEHYDLSDHAKISSLVDAAQGTPIFFVGGLGELEHRLRERLSKSQDHALAVTSSPPSNNSNANHLYGPSDTDTLKQPQFFASIAADCGLRVPPTWDATRDCPTVAPGSRWLSKSIRSSGGLSVSWVDDAVFQRQLVSDPTRRSTIIQQWIPGRLFGATFFATSDAASTKLLAVFRSRFTRYGDKPFVYAGSAGPHPVTPQLKQRLVEFGRRVAGTWQLRGLFNVDFIVTPDRQAWVLEINPRWTAASELVELKLRDEQAITTDDSLMKHHIEAHLGNGASILNLAGNGNRPGETTYWIKRVVRAQRRGRIDLATLHQIVSPYPIHIADIPRAETIHERGAPFVSMILRIDRPAASSGTTISAQEFRQLMRRLGGCTLPVDEPYRGVHHE